MCYSILKSSEVQRVLPNIKCILQLNEWKKLEYRYLYQIFIEITLYGCELPPYHLPIFLPLRVFAIEFIRQSLSTCQMHFLLRNKEARFKLKAQVQPFTVNTKAVEKEVDFCWNK